VAVSIVRHIAGLSLTVRNAERLGNFYMSALGFRRTGTEARDTGFALLMGLRPMHAQAVHLQLGGQLLELVAFAEQGAPWPEPGAGDDPWFQHLAIAVSDMRAAYAQLCGHSGWAPISQDGPQHLPAASGGVTAFKFRDPEGHPLELLEFPTGHVPIARQMPVAARTHLGIDHTAIVVADSEASVAFYAGTGLSVGARSNNHGIEQARLDDLTDPVVEVTALEPTIAAPPHLELLCYRAPLRAVSAPARKHSNDAVATRLLLATDDVAAAASDLAAQGACPIAAGSFRMGPAALLRDPDGHDLLLVTTDIVAAVGVIP